MQSSSAAIGLDRTSASCPPPNSSAVFRAVNDQVTASWKPAAARARRAARARAWRGVSTPPVAWGTSGRGVAGSLSKPAMRATSSTRSALPSTSRRQVGGVTVTLVPRPSALKPSLARISSTPSRPIDRPDRRCT